MNASRLPGVNRLKQFWRVSERRQTNLLEKKKKGGEFRLGEGLPGPHHLGLWIRSRILDFFPKSYEKPWKV